MYCQVCGAAEPTTTGVLRPLPPEAAGALGARRRRGSSYEEQRPRRASRSTSTCSSASRSWRRRSSAPPRPCASSSAPCTSRRRTSSSTRPACRALRELLEQEACIGCEEWSELWESKMDYQLLALEKRERFLAIKERIAALYHGDKRKVVPAAPGGRRVRPLRLRHRARGRGAGGRLQARPRQLRAGLLPRRDPLQRGRRRAGAGLLHARPGGQARPLRGAGLQRRHPLRARRPRRAPRST